MTTDYPYELNAAQAQAFNTALNGNFPDTIALDSTISFPNQSARMVKILEAFENVESAMI
jgi:hypothetical protein